MAVVVVNEGASITPAELRKFLADKVVRWWLPERWTFADEIPRTSVGKYDKKTIRARYAEDGYTGDRGARLKSVAEVRNRRSCVPTPLGL